MSFQERFKQSGPYVLGGSTLILEQLSKVAELIPSPYVKPGIELVLSILNVVQTMKEHKETCQELITQLGRLLLVVLKPWVKRADDDIPKELRDNLKELEKELRVILSKLENIRDTPKWKAVLRIRDRTGKLAECQQLMNQAISFFQVDSLIDGALKLDGMDRKVDAILEAVTITSETKYASCVLPPAPDALFGRKLYVENVVEHLCYLPGRGDGDQPAPQPPRLAILGPGGIGKTTVALAAVADHRVKAMYEDRVHWVPSEEATTPELLIELIARSMGLLNAKGSDRKRDIIDFLHSSTKPRLLLLDNFETPWDIPAKQSEVNDILYDIASISPLTILLTMRSDAPPPTRIRWTKPSLPPLASLSPEAAREMYLDIHEDAGEDRKLDDLLHELAHMPLALRLMATRGSLGEMPSALLELWKDERIRAKLLHQGDDRITSVTVSVELSINSHLMRTNPDALALLSILAELPGGARQDFIRSVAPSILDHGGALGTLRRAALVQINTSARQIHLLSPVRSFVLDTHRAPEAIRSTMRQAYFSLIQEYSSQPGDELFIDAVPIMTLEAVNIETVLMDAMVGEASVACIDAVFTYAKFQSYTIPRAEIIQKAVSVVQSGDEGYGPRYLFRGLILMAVICRKLDRYEDAVEATQKALSICQRIGDQLGEANCLDGLGDSYRMLGQYGDAIRAAQKALPIYQQAGAQLGEANCLDSLGESYRMLDRYADAVSAAQKALPIYQRIGDQLGEANSLQSLGDSYRMLGKYEDAVKAAQKALPIYQRIGAWLGEANCLDGLGDSYRMLGLYEDAMDATHKALPIYQRIGDRLGEASCLDSLGESYRMLGRHEDALSVAQKALPVYQRIGARLGEANCLDSLGESYRMLDRYADAVDAAQKALPIYQQIRDQLGEANCLDSLGNSYRMMDRYEDAVDAAQRALPIYQKIGVQLGEASCLRSLARAYGWLGRTEDGVQVALEALKIFLRIDRDADAERCRAIVHALGGEVS